MGAQWKRPEAVLVTWSLLALAALWPAAKLLGGSFPVFTVLWIVVPLVAAARSKDAARVGFRAVPWRGALRAAAIALGGLLLLALAVEPWSHTYRMLLQVVLSQDRPDTTFAWLLRLPRLPALGAMTLYSGLVTLYGEELFFRGWLLQLLQRRWGARWAIVGQAALFVIPNLLASLALPPLQGALYALVYTFFGVGLIGGWAAWRTGSIWPSLVAATLLNLAFVVGG